MRNRTAEEIASLVLEVESMMSPSEQNRHLAAFLSDYVRENQWNRRLLKGLKERGRYTDEEVRQGLFDTDL